MMILALKRVAPLRVVDFAVEHGTYFTPLSFLFR